MVEHDAAPAHGIAGPGRHHRRHLLLRIAAAVIVPLLVVVLLALTAAPRSALRARADAAVGHETWAPVLAAATERTREVLDPVAGAPIGEQTRIDCSADDVDERGRRAQTCTLRLTLTYELSDPAAQEEAALAGLEATELESGQRWARDEAPAFVGRRIAVLGAGELSGGVTVAGPGDEPPFTDEVITCTAPTAMEQVVRDAGTRPETDTWMEVGVVVEISRTTLARDLLPGDCLLGYREAALPRIEGYS